MPDKHALLSASSASRWLNCPPSARLTENMPDTESIYAKEGTLAHEMCEVKLMGFTTPTPKRTVTARLNKLKKHELYKPEMDGYTDVYVDYVKNLALSFDSRPGVFIEKQVDYSNYAPGGFGTSDCIIVCGEDLHIIDFKYGKGVPVSAEDNPQMKLYALGAVNLYGMFYPIKTVHLAIVQPRLDIISEWEISLPDLLQWGEVLNPQRSLHMTAKATLNRERIANSVKPPLLAANVRRITLSSQSVSLQSLFRLRNRTSLHLQTMRLEKY